MLGRLWLPTDVSSLQVAIVLFMATYWFISCMVRLIVAMQLPITIVIFARVSRLGKLHTKI